jgi:hypothetical protein
MYRLEACKAANYIGSSVEVATMEYCMYAEPTYVVCLNLLFLRCNGRLPKR